MATTIYTGNYIGKTNAQLGLTQELSTSPDNGVYTPTILDVTDKYQIDLRSSMLTYKPEETPLLTILENIGSKACNAPYHVWTDEYDGMSWWDIGLDTLRLKAVVYGSASTAKQSVFSGTTSATYNDQLMPAKFNTAADATATTARQTGGQIKIMCATAHCDDTANLDRAADATMAVNATDQAVATLQDTTDGAYGIGLVPTYGSTNKVWFFIKKENDYTVGQIEEVWNKLRNLMVNLGYVEVIAQVDQADAEANHECPMLIGETATANYTPHLPVYMAFNNLHTCEGTGSTVSDYVVSSYNNVLVRIDRAYYGPIANTRASSTEKYLGIRLDFNDSNITTNIGAYSGTNFDSVLIGSPVALGTFASGADYNKPYFDSDGKALYISSFMRLVQIGNPTAAADPIPEGDTFAEGGNFFVGREENINYTQIFASKKYGITGTHQASSFRFADDFIKTREKHFSIYKKQMNATYLFGQKGMTYINGAAGNFMVGQPVRQMGGFMDYSLFPINYLRKPLPRIGWSSNMNGEEYIITWIDDLAESVKGFRNNGGQNQIYLCSSNFGTRLNIYIRQFMANPRLMGAQLVNYTAPSALNMYMPSYEFVTTRGINVKFVVDQALDYMTSLPVPYWIFGQASLNPKDVLFSIDQKNIKRVTLRPDKLHGNIQNIGQDAFMEAMRGESSFELRFPHNHSIIYAPEI